jgi:hypothetical protein
VREKSGVAAASRARTKIHASAWRSGRVLASTRNPAHGAEASRCFQASKSQPRFSATTLIIRSLRGPAGALRVISVTFAAATGIRVEGLRRPSRNQRTAWSKSRATRSGSRASSRLHCPFIR